MRLGPSPVGTRFFSSYPLKSIFSLTRTFRLIDFTGCRELPLVNLKLHLFEDLSVCGLLTSVSRTTSDTG